MDRPCAMGVLNSLFQVALHLPSLGPILSPDPVSIAEFALWCFCGGLRFLLSEKPHQQRGPLLITEFIKEDSPFCPTRAITRTMMQRSLDPRLLSIPRRAYVSRGGPIRPEAGLSDGSPAVGLAPPAPRPGSNRPFEDLDLYWRSPESGDLWYTSRQLKRTVWSRSDGWRQPILGIQPHV